MVLKECPAYEDCLLWYRTHGFDKEFFQCDGCTSYKCYELGFMQGVREGLLKAETLIVWSKTDKTAEICEEDQGNEEV